jgi:hypothetical protein
MMVYLQTSRMAAPPPSSKSAEAHPQGAGRRARGDARSSKLGGSLRTLFLIMLLAGSAVLFLGMGSVISPGKRSLLYPRPLLREQKKVKTGTLSVILKEHRENNATRRQDNEQAASHSTTHLHNETGGVDIYAKVHVKAMNSSRASGADAFAWRKKESSADQTRALGNANIVKTGAENKVVAVGNQTVSMLQSESRTQNEHSSSGTSHAHSTTKSSGGFARLFMARTADEQTGVVGVARPFRVESGQQITLVMARFSLCMYVRACVCVRACACACVCVYALSYASP